MPSAHRGCTKCRIGPAPSPTGSLSAYRELGSEGEAWPDWLRATRDACGVYVIKQAGKVVYVGSSRKRLYDTVTRHFQRWARNKKWWSGAYGAGHDPGMTYQRARCTVAIRLVACGDETEVEAQLIERLRPRDNLVERPDGSEEEIPF